MIYIHDVFFHVCIYRNLNKIRDVLYPISLDKIDLLNEWIYEELRRFL